MTSLSKHKTGETRDTANLNIDKVELPEDVAALLGPKSRADLRSFLLMTKDLKASVSKAWTPTKVEKPNEATVLRQIVIRQNAAKAKAKAAKRANERAFK